ncbi:hypothetical protein BJ170DRAFT_32564 [Xylariales sp. AK1849]|nr:hypothetical protein BJ170DRAFT_32564 [Xylariales sp. AK1849]
MIHLSLRGDSLLRHASITASTMANSRCLGLVLLWILLSQAQNIWALAGPESLRDEDEARSVSSPIVQTNTTAGQAEGNTDTTHFFAALERQEIDPYCDCLYPTEEAPIVRNISTVDDDQRAELPANRLQSNNSYATVPTNSSISNSLAEAESDVMISDTDSVSMPQLDDDIFKLQGYTYSEDNRWREQLYGDRHSLFGLGTVLLTISPPKTRGKRKRNATSDDASDDAPDEHSPLGEGESIGKLFDPFLHSRYAPQDAKSSDQRRSNATKDLEPDEGSKRSDSQPVTRPISHEQLIAEVKGIYAGLVIVESKCIEIQNTLSSVVDTKLNDAQWQALIALHRTLLHENHDFFLCSQYPGAKPAIRRLASKYAMPARMWRHGIYAFLELLRCRLPASLEYMLKFIYLAYSMMALMYETVPSFEDTWSECLGDLGRYRLAIDNNDIRDRRLWATVSVYWYSKVSNKLPTTGRLYHHLAILSHPNALQQLFYYTKSLAVTTPFCSSGESMTTLFDSSNSPNRIQAIDAAYIRIHASLFRRTDAASFTHDRDAFLTAMELHIARDAHRWVVSGYYIAIIASNSIISYGNPDNPFMEAMAKKQASGDGFQQEKSGTAPLASPILTPPSWDFDALELTFVRHAMDLASRTDEIVLRRCEDPNILPYVHVRLVFLNHMVDYPELFVEIGRQFPWALLASLLNSLNIPFYRHDRDIDRSSRLIKPNDKPLPEDFGMRGLLWTERYFPEGWFPLKANHYQIEGMINPVLSHTIDRVLRILSLGLRLARCSNFLRYDPQANLFGALQDLSTENPNRDFGSMELDLPGEVGQPIESWPREMMYSDESDETPESSQETLQSSTNLSSWHASLQRLQMRTTTRSLSHHPRPKI